MKKITTNIVFSDYSDISESIVEFEIPEYCPKCKIPFLHEFSEAIVTYKKKIEIFMYCEHCSSSFIAIYSEIKSRNYGKEYVATKLEKCEPSYPENKVFSSEITSFSPMFEIIYNQANFAENNSLDQISGMGYRKALEFLIKDYCILINPDNEDNIKNMSLSNCINNYIDNEKIKSNAIVSTWLANDETHYVRKFENSNISTLKKFIKAVVNYIEFEFSTDESKEMIRNKKINNSKKIELR